MAKPNFSISLPAVVYEKQLEFQQRSIDFYRPAGNLLIPFWRFGERLGLHVGDEYPEPGMCWTLHRAGPGENPYFGGYGKVPEPFRYTVREYRFRYTFIWSAYDLTFLDPYRYPGDSQMVAVERYQAAHGATIAPDDIYWERDSYDMPWRCFAWQLVEIKVQEQRR